MIEITSNRIVKYNITSELELIQFLKDINLSKNINLDNHSFVATILTHFNNQRLSLTEFRKAFSRLLLGISKFQPLFWTSRGFSLDDSKKLANQHGSDTAKKLHNSRTPEERIYYATIANNKRTEQIADLKKTNPQKLKEQTATCIEYYIAKGMSYEDAFNALKERQTTFSKVKMIELYGQEEGMKLVTIRNDKWMKSLKENNDWEVLSKSKAVTLDKFIQKYGEIAGTEKYKNMIGKMIVPIGKASKESLQVFLPLLAEFKDHFTCYLGYDDSVEWFIWDDELKQIFSYDFTLKEPKIIIEYHGIKFHPNKTILSEDEWQKWESPFSKESAEEVLKKDQYKKILAERHGFKILELWGSTPINENILLGKKFILSNLS